MTVPAKRYDASNLWTCQETARLMAGNDGGQKSAVVFTQVQRQIIFTRELPLLGERIGLLVLARQVGHRQAFNTPCCFDARDWMPQRAATF